MAETIVTLSGDDRALLAALKRITGAQDGVDAGLKKIKKTSKESSTEMEKMLDGGIAKIGAWAAGLASVATVTATVNAGIEKTIQLQDNSLQAFQALAKAQQEAAKNLAGVSPEKISAALQEDVPKIALEAGFSDLPALTKALGSSASIVGDELAKSVVATAAQMERLTPENLQTTATSTADLVKATGVTDAREAMAMLLSAGSVARPEELGRLSLGAAKAVNAGVLATPGQSQVDAAKESAALFAMLSKVDKSGESAATATVQMIDQLRTLFQGRENDPGSTVGRLQALRGDEELKAAFLKDMKGEAIFKPLFESLVNETSAESSELANALRTVTTDVAVFDNALKTLNMTPQQRVANATAAVDTAVNVQAAQDDTAARLAAVRDITNKAFDASSTGIFTAIGGMMKSTFDPLLASQGNDVGFANAQVTELLRRRTNLVNADPNTPGLENKIRTVDTAIAQIETLMQGRKGFVAARDNEYAGDSKFTTDNPSRAIQTQDATRPVIVASSGNAFSSEPVRLQSQPDGRDEKLRTVDAAIKTIENGTRPNGTPERPGAAVNDAANANSANSRRALEEQTAEVKKQTALLERIAAGTESSTTGPRRNAPTIPTPAQVREQAGATP